MSASSKLWIRDNWNVWEKICRINSKSFSCSELLLLEENNENGGFDIILTVLLTEYSKELFLDDIVLSSDE